MTFVQDGIMANEWLLLSVLSMGAQYMDERSAYTWVDTSPNGEAYLD